MLPVWSSFPAGILIATVASAVGLGGGVMWMPFLILALKLPPETTVLTSLLIQLAGMTSGTIAFLKLKRGDLKLAFLYLGVAVPGLLAGSHISLRLSASHMEMILGWLTMVTAFMFVSSSDDYEDVGLNRAEIRKAARYSWVTVFASFITGMLSISMSEWLIPLMRGRLTMRMSSAIATCIFIALGACIVGSSMHLAMGGSVNWMAVGFGVPGVLIGGQIGPRITQRIDERRLKEVFVFLLTLIGIHMIYNAY